MMADDLENYTIPKLLDAPNMALWFEVDTAMIGMSGLFTVAFVENPLHIVGAVVLSITLARYYARVKASGGRGMIKQIIYWYLPGNKNNQPINPRIREYRG